MSAYYKILHQFAELLAAKMNMDISVVICSITGVMVPIIMVLYAILSYYVLFQDKKWFRQYREWLQFLWVLLTLGVIAAVVGIIVYSCL